MIRYLKIGKESEYGTPVDGAYVIPITSESLKLSQGFIRARTVASRWREISIPGPKSVGGGWKQFVNYKNVGLILKAALGGESVSNPTSGVWLHEFSPVNSNELPSLTVRVGIDVAEKIVSGYGVDKLSFEISPTDPLTLSVDGVGRDESIGELDQNPAFITQGYISPADASVKVGGVEVEVESLKLEIENNLASDHHQLGSRLLPRVEVGELEVRGELTVRFLSTSHLNDFLDCARKKLEVRFDGEEIADGYGYFLEFVVDSMEYDSGDANIDRQERLVQDLKFTAVKGDGPILLVRLQNDEESEY